MPMKRRNFIFTPFLLIAGNSLAGIQRDAGYSLNPSSQSVAQLLKQFREPLFAAEVGKQYLYDNPSLDKQELAFAIGLNDSSESYHSVYQQFENKKARDFEVGNTLCIEGWVLSKAEVSLCALAFIATLNS